MRDVLGLNLLVKFASTDGTDLGCRNLENLIELGFSLVDVGPIPAWRQLCRKCSLSMATRSNIPSAPVHRPVPGRH